MGNVSSQKEMKKVEYLDAPTEKMEVKRARLEQEICSDDCLEIFR